MTANQSVEFPDQDFTLPDDFQTGITVSHPAFEQRHDNPNLDFGIGCVELAFRLIGPRGAMEYHVFTGWYLPHVTERLRRETDHRFYEPTGHYLRCSLEGHPGRTFFHSRTPQWEGQEHEECELLDGPCYIDVGFGIGDHLWEGLVTGGEPGLWKRMKELHDGLGEST